MRFLCRIGLHKWRRFATSRGTLSMVPRDYLRCARCPAYGVHYIGDGVYRISAEEALRVQEKAVAR